MAFFAASGLQHLRAEQSREWWHSLDLARDEGDQPVTAELTHRLVRLPGTVDSDHELAEACLESSNWSDLTRVLERLSAAGPGEQSWVLGFEARRREALKDPAGALDLWSRLLLRSDLVTAQRLQAWEGLANAHEALGHWEDASRAVDSLISLSDTAEYRVLRLRLLVQRRQWSVLESDVQILKTRFPSDRAVVPVLPGLERLVRNLDTLRAAEDEVEQAPAAVAPLLQRAEIEVYAGLWRLAAEDFQEVAVRNPRIHAARLLASELGLGERDSSESLQTGKPARLPWLASSVRLAGFEARLERAFGAWEALRNVTELLMIAPPAKEVTPALASLLSQQALAEYRLGWTTLAQSDAREALTFAPTAWEAKWVRAQELAERHHLVGALSLLESCAEGYSLEDPTVPTLVQESAATWLQALGRHEEAVKVLTACLERERRSSLLRSRAKSLEILGRKDDAEADLEEAEFEAPDVEDEPPAESEKEPESADAAATENETSENAEVLP